MKVKTLIVASLVIAGLMAVFALYAASLVPAGTQLPTHWNAAGDVDGTMPALQALLFPVGVVLVSTLLLGLIPRMEPLQDRLEASAALLRTAWIGILALMVLIEAAIAAPAFGVKIPVALPMLGVGALFVALGNVLPKSRPGFFVGIRTPWAIMDTDNWIATHRLGGKLMILAGLVIVLASLLPLPANVRTPAIFGALAACIVPPLAYSWWLWHRKMRVRG
jgi:uncharacterized membrane protein